MCNINFLLPGSYFVYGPGVNAANLTSKDIAKANAKLRPQLKATQGDAGKDSAFESACGGGSDALSQYSSWTRKELCKAIVERRIKSRKAVAKTARLQLIDTLRKADKNPKFSRFLVLPAELRNEIYKLAIADLDHKGLPRVRPASPKICRVSKQIRSESLPLFLHSIEQNIIVSWVRVGPKSLRLQKAVLCDEYHTYFKNARKLGWLQHMRRFHFRVMKHSDRNRKTKMDPNARYYVKFADAMQTVDAWVEKGENKESFLGKIQAVMATTIGGRSTTMSENKFNLMVAIFLDAVDLQFAE